MYNLAMIAPNDKPTVILHVLDKITIDSGVSAVVMNYFAKLNHARITFDFLLFEKPTPDICAYIATHGGRVHLLPRLTFPSAFKYFAALKTIFKDNDYQIIHGHLANSAVFYMDSNIPHRIIHSHNTALADSFIKRVRNRLLTAPIKKTANIFAACSTDSAEFLFGDSPAVIINNAIDVPKFTFSRETRTSMRDKLGLHGKFVIGHVGRFSKQKNHTFIIDIFREILNKRNDARLILIGDGKLRPVIERKIRALAHAVLFIGTTDNIPAYLNAMDLFILPSLFEGLPVAAIEAQAAGLPVILSDNITREAAASDKALFLPLDKKLWVEKILESKKERINIDMGGRFCAATQAQLLCDFYENILREQYV